MTGYPAVLWPPHRHDLVMHLDEVLFLVRHLTGTLPEDEADYPEPTEDEIDAWMGVPPDWEPAA